MEWKTVKLGDVCKIFGRIGFRGYTNNDFVTKPEDGAITLSPTNIVDGELDLTKCAYINWDKYYESPEIMVQENDILLSKTGTIGRTALVKRVEHPMTINPQFVLLKECTINPRYLSYLLKTPKFQGDLYSITVGSVIATLSQKNLGNIKIDIVDSATQDKIAAILASLDDKIENNNRINANLEVQAQAIFKSWFVDFEPWGRVMPEDWKEGLFVDLINIMPGGTPSTNVETYWKGGTIPFFSPKDAKGVYCFDTEKHITELGLSNCSSRLYEKDTLFITARGTVGKLALAGVPMAMNQSNYALVAKSGVGCHFLYLLAQTIIDILLKKANGAVFSAITTRDFKEPVIIPTASTMMKFESIVSPLFDKIYQNCEENQRLAALRDSLLPKLMKGEIAL